MDQQGASTLARLQVDKAPARRTAQESADVEDGRASAPRTKRAARDASENGAAGHDLVATAMSWPAAQAISGQDSQDANMALRGMCRPR